MPQARRGISDLTASLGSLLTGLKAGFIFEPIPQFWTIFEIIFKKLLVFFTELVLLCC
ncbi:hypothetical protein JOD01_002978 [Brevibacillus fulvus]|uniref:Uncharacterized protein n=1 Tax=Brevibacillus fulvus TaxID=1125967 RepID=A0A938XZX7_9BACL|nr:hypothetical protein [Brevibacillus fulvus]